MLGYVELEEMFNARWADSTAAGQAEANHLRTWCFHWPRAPHTFLFLPCMEDGSRLIMEKRLGHPASTTQFTNGSWEKASIFKTSRAKDMLQLLIGASFS